MSTSDAGSKRGAEDDIRELASMEADVRAHVEAQSSDFDEDLTKDPREASSSRPQQGGDASQRKPWRRARFAASSAGVAGIDASVGTRGSAGASAGGRGAMESKYASTAQLREDLARVRALASGGASARASVAPMHDDADDLADEDDSALGPTGANLASQGVGVDYCIFCYHGTHFLRHDNTALLTKFVSERGSILPKRFTKCCAKHQRKLAHTIRRARWLNLIPWQQKLHPKLRFTSLTPDPAGIERLTEAPQAVGEAVGSAPSTAFNSSPAVGGDRAAPITSAAARGVDAALRPSQ